MRFKKNLFGCEHELRLPSSLSLVFSLLTYERQTSLECGCPSWTNKRVSGTSIPQDDQIPTGPSNSKPKGSDFSESIDRVESGRFIRSIKKKKKGSRSQLCKQWGFPGGSDGKESCRRPGFDPWVEKIP